MRKKIISYLPFAIVLFFLLASIRIFNLSYPLSVTTSSSEFAVIGEGRIEVRPDVATVNVGVTVNNASTVDEAQKTINEINQSIIKSLQAISINKNEIETSNYSVYPNYGPDGTRIVGYNGYINIDVKVKNTNMVGKVIEEATKAGANQINGVQFSIDNPDTYRQKARQKAIQNAKTQAEKLSKELNLKIGKIVNMIESTQGTDLMPQSGGYGGGASAGPQVEPGSQTISSIVTLYFEKK